MQILHLEDSSNDAELIRIVLRREWPDCVIRHATNAGEFDRALGEGTYDVILSDYSMPGFNGLAALTQAQQRCPATPFLFLSGMIGEERAVEALKRGATDYIIKDRPARLVPAIRKALAFVDESSRRRHSEEALRENDERFRLIAENIADQITVLDLEGWQTYGNEAARAIFGQADPGPGNNWLRHLHPEDAVRVRQILDRIVRTGTGEHFEFRVRRSDGSVRHLEGNGAALRNGGGFVTNILVVSRDVTERRAAEVRLREQASLLDKARDAIIATDLNHRITYWNASAERVYGAAAAEVLGRKLNEIGLNFDPTRFAAAAAEVLAKGEWRGDFRLQTVSGTPVLVDSTWSLVMESDGRPRSILIIDTDTTERKKLESQLLRTQRLESVGTLAGGIAHDLNNVLTPILLTIDLLSDYVASPEERELIEKTRASASHGAALVRQLLAFARGGDGERISIEPGAALVNVEPLIRQCLPAKIDLLVRSDETPWRIEANATQFNQVLVNLALNARDAMPDGGQLVISTANVAVDAATAAANPGTAPGDYLRISVRDTGTGMPPEVLDRIFDPFFTTKAVGKGTGLGLSMVAGIMKSHHGFIQVESETARGTAFHLYFPAQAKGTREAQNDPTSLSGGDGEGVLLIDDEPAVRDALRSLLQRAGYAVFPAGDAESALKEFDQHREHVALVITDMMLPDQNGLDVVRALRSKSPQLPVVAISGMMASGCFDELLELDPPVECLAKPLPPKVLLNAARRALRTAA